MPKRRKITSAKKRQALQIDSDSSDDEIYTSDDDVHTGARDDDAEPADLLDQDEDIIRAAEEAQLEDLEHAAQSAELEVLVAEHDQAVASKAVSKVVWGPPIIINH